MKRAPECLASYTSASSRMESSVLSDPVSCCISSLKSALEYRVVMNGASKP